MSATDVPLHLGLGGRVAGEFVARPGPRRLAQVAVRWVLVAGAVAVAVARRRQLEALAPAIAILATVFLSVTLVGLAVRRARVTIDAGGVRWGWGSLGVRMDRDRLRSVGVYTDAIALVPRRGSTWFLSARDWDRFDAMARAVARADLPVEVHPRRAPWRARLQSYGRVLDGLLLGAMLGASALIVVAATARRDRRGADENRPTCGARAWRDGRAGRYSGAPRVIQFMISR